MAVWGRLLQLHLLMLLPPLKLAVAPRSRFRKEPAVELMKIAMTISMQATPLLACCGPVLVQCLLSHLLGR